MINYLKEREWCLYCHINKINGKRYFGITSTKPNKRWQNGKGYKQCIKFNSAIQKYGWDNFEHIIMRENLSYDEACFLEQYYIKQFNTTDSKYGYNIDSGGRISSIIKYGKDNPSSRAVICLNTKEIFETERQACEKYNLNSSSLSETCNGKRHYCGLFNEEKLAWMFLDEYTEDKAKERLILANHKVDVSGVNNPMYGKCGDLHPSYGKVMECFKGGNNPSAKKIMCLTTNEVFDTATEAAKKYNTDISHIIKCCRGKLKSSGRLEDGTKLQWKYYEE